MALRVLAACGAGHAAYGVIEDFANEIGVGDVFDDAKLATAERAEGCAPRGCRC